MGHAILQVVFKGRVVQAVPLDRELLTIGRMKDNDVVIDNLSVSRHHARVRVDGDEVSIEDLGSGNGCLVNGIRVERGVITPEDEVFIGKHQLVVVSPESETAVVPGTSGPAAADSPWDDAHTYFVAPEEQAKLVAGSEATGSGEEMDVDLEPDTADDLEDLPEAELEEADDGQASGAPEIQLGPEAELEEADPGQASGPLATPEVHGGLIIQRQGKLDRIVPVDCSPLVLGRAGSCNVLLDGSGVSRRHAQLIRDGDRFEIEDLDSANGTFVNGDRVERRELNLGDEIGIDEFRMTFVMESRPIAHEIVVAPPRPESPAQSHEDLAQTVWSETARPGPEVPVAEVIEEADVAVAGDPAVHVDPPSALGEIEDLLSSVAQGHGEAPDAGDFSVADPESRPEPVIEIPVEGGDSALDAEAVAAASTSDVPADVRESQQPIVTDARGPIHLELELDAADLPPELAEALGALDEAGLRISATLRLRR